MIFESINSNFVVAVTMTVILVVYINIVLPFGFNQKDSSLVSARES